jgi:lipoprotein signal peptidase
MAKHGFGGWESAPGCIQHNVPGSEGVYKSYEKCADYFTFGKGSTFGTLADGVNSSYWVLTAIGFIVMVGFLVWWVMLEDRKLKAQAAHLLRAGMGGTAPPGRSG